MASEVFIFDTKQRGSPRILVIYVNTYYIAGVFIIFIGPLLEADLQNKPSMDPRQLLPPATTEDACSTYSQVSGGTDTLDAPSSSAENLQTGEPSSPRRSHLLTTLIGPEGTTGIQFPSPPSPRREWLSKCR